MRALALCFVRWLTLACSVGLAVSARAAPSQELAVRAVLDEQVAAWNRGDLEGYMKGYWRSPALSFFAGGTRTRGYEDTLARYRRRYQAEGRAMGSLAFEGLTIEVLAPEAAIARGGWQLRFADGKISRGLFTVVLQKLPEGWRIVHDHSSSE